MASETCGCIYVIDCFDTDDLYIGSTNNFRTRISQHKYNCNNEKSEAYNLKLYQTIREYGGWDNWAMFAIEEQIPLEQLKEREQFYIENLKPSLNNCNAIKNKDYIKIWRSFNKDKVCATAKRYRERHKEKVNDKANKKIECECGGSYLVKHRAVHMKTQKHIRNMENKISVKVI